MSKPNIKPLGDRVLVKRRKDAEQIKGGIVIPDTAKEQSQEAEVIALGTGHVCECKDDCCKDKKISFEVKAGDRVLINRYGGNEIKMDGEEYLIIRQNDILAILSSEKSGV